MNIYPLSVKMQAEKKSLIAVIKKKNIIHESNRLQKY